jgi:hypothetical protein
MCVHTILRVLPPCMSVQGAADMREGTQAPVLDS